VIDLAYYHSKSVKEIAEIVGINEATVKTRMFYAQKIGRPLGPERAEGPAVTQGTKRIHGLL